MTHTPISSPEPDDVGRGIVELERYVAAHAPVPEASPPSPAPALGEGETRRVRRWRGEVAEARRLAELQDDDAPLLVDTDKVRKVRKRAAEAVRLHALTQDPAMLALRDQRVRRVATAMTMGAASVALAVSSIGVQASVAKALDLEAHSVGWWAAFGVEPALSLPLLAAVAVQAYSAMRGTVVDRKSPQGRRLARVEALLLGLTLILNCWPAFVGGFDLLSLVVHSLGPIAAVTAIWVLPTLWQVLAALPLPRSSAAALTGPTAGPTGPTYRANVGELADRVRAMISAGELPPAPSASRIQKTLRCGMDTARAVRDVLAGGAS
ncbi:hypothetical protein [Bailinhaonella thermotolerans]|uniref:Uncharacterized protein n=1 Tax=Bailinhaonella thermotolerans TaxID=1070861 RepID=A0A3A4AMB3_9ACTN|nr:hypothetical protein [Bailinhaonella thermotolerans]RJL20198.1 hypothetical protein D5H75_39825 [Bailinhaonella thermotolerans]